MKMRMPKTYMVDRIQRVDWIRHDDVAKYSANGWVPFGTIASTFHETIFIAIRKALFLVLSIISSIRVSQLVSFVSSIEFPQLVAFGNAQPFSE